MNCPNCKETMIEASGGKDRVFICPQCGAKHIEDYRVARGILHDPGNPEPAEKAIWRIRSSDINNLQAENAALKEVLAALVAERSGWFDEVFGCNYCNDGKHGKVYHAPDCPVARAQELLK